MYRAWVSEQGIVQIGCAEQLRFERSTMEEEPDSSGLVITFPDDGDIFTIDPVLRRAYQSLKLEVVVSTAVERVTWMVDGQPLAEVAAPYVAHWPLQPGRHMLQAIAVDHLPPLRSPHVYILVLSP
jgi:hypothetical protein